MLTRRSLLNSVGGIALLGFMGCISQVGCSSNSSHAPDDDRTTVTGEKVWEQPLALQSEKGDPSYVTPPKRFEKTIYVVVNGDFSGSLLGFDEKTGEETHRIDLPDAQGRYAQVLFQDGKAFLVNGEGFTVAVDLATAEVLWKSECAQGAWTLGYSKSGGQKTEQIAKARWYVTEPVYKDGLIYVGFSTFVDSPGSLLCCISSKNGEVLWGKEYEGRFSFSGGAVQVTLSDYGLLVPVPECPEVDLIEYETGRTIATAAIDDRIGMGCSSSCDGSVYYTQTMNGSLYELRVEEEGLCATCLADVRGEGESDSLRTWATRPVPVGDSVVCNASFSSAENSPNKVGRYSLSLSADSLRCSSGYFGTTPVVLHDGSDEGSTLLTAREDGLWLIELTEQDIEFKPIEKSIRWFGDVGPELPISDDKWVYVVNQSDGRNILTAVR